MKQMIKVSAPGKLILMGEHSVVYGKPAIIAAVDRRCCVTIAPRPDKKIEIISKNLQISEITDEKIIINKTKTSNMRWQKFSKTNDIKLLKSIIEKPLDYLSIAIGETFNFYNKKLFSGFSLSIDSEIPIGSGMGSSAALAVSISAAVSLLLDEKLDKEKINKIAFLCEQKMHGKPSGGDKSTSCYGGLVWFQKEKGVKPLEIKLSTEITKNFYVINTGTPDESTGEMVSLVRSLYQEKPNFVDGIFADQQKLTEQLLDAFKNEDKNEIMRIIKLGEKNLEKIGVVSSSAKTLIKDIIKGGGAAKISGAGGRTNSSGIVITYHQNINLLESVIKSFKYKYSQFVIGAEGVRREL